MTAGVTQSETGAAETRGGVTLHAADVVLPMSAGPIAAGAVAVSGGRVLEVGPADELAGRYPGARTRRWHGVLTPGLVNAHAHLQYTDYADLARGGVEFAGWVRELTARRASTTDRQWQEATRRGIHELLATGTTSVADVVTDPVVLRVTARSGLGGISYVEVVAVDEPRWPEARRRLLSVLSGVPAGRTIGISPHTVYTLGSGVLRDVGVVARSRGLRLHTHLAESAAEVEYVLSGSGPLADAMSAFGFAFELLAAPGGVSPARHLDLAGGLGPDVHVAHGVHVDAGDRALLRERESVVVLCPRSNAVLGAGASPVAAYLQEGNAVAVGTDSRASVPSLDLLDDVKALRDLARSQGYARADLERRLVEAATTGGASAMGADDIGRLAPGTRADLAVFAVPTEGDVWSALVEHGAGSCVATVLGGRLVHRGTVGS